MSHIGIMSMQRIANHGSFLQAYALKTLLEAQGHRVEFVDYRPGPTVIPVPARGPARLARKALETLGLRAPLSQRLAYIRYKRTYGDVMLPLLGIGKEPNTPHVDTLVIGSDEVFNCIQANPNVGFTPQLFGHDADADRTVTYAASFGNTTLGKLRDHGKDREVGRLLAGLDAISVRDENSSRIVESLTGLTPQMHVDPVFAYDFVGDPNIPATVASDAPYLIAYAYSGRLTRAECASIRDYAQRRGLDVISIGGVQSCADRFVNCTPFETLAWFRNATEVITDTFHGSIFSIIAHTPFTTLVRPSRGEAYGNEEKLTSLLGRLRLMDRMTSDIADMDRINATVPDWGRTEVILQTERARTQRYLHEEVR